MRLKLRSGSHLELRPKLACQFTWSSQSWKIWSGGCCEPCIAQTRVFETGPQWFRMIHTASGEPHEPGRESSVGGRRGAHARGGWAVLGGRPNRPVRDAEVR